MERLSAQSMAVSLLISNLEVPRDAFRLAVRQYPSKPAIICENAQLSYQDLSDRVLRLATGLMTIGIGAGSRIFAMVEDRLTQIEIQLAAYELGAELIMFNHTHTPNEIVEAKDIIEPDLFIYQPLKALHFDRLPELFNESLIVRLGEQDSYEYIVNCGKARQVPFHVNAEGPCLTTFLYDPDGFATPVCFSQMDVLSNLRLILSHLAVYPEMENKRFISLLSFFAHGSSMLLPHLLLGSAIIVGEPGNSTELAELVDEEQATHLFMTPCQLIDLLDDKDADVYNFMSLKNIVIGTDQLPAAVFEEAAFRFGNILQTSFGLTDLYSLVSILKASDYVDRGNLAPRQLLRSVGRVVPPIQHRIIDRSGTPVSQGAIGELQLQSPSLRVDRLQPGESAPNQESIRWIRSGEQAYIDENNLLHILNRSNQVLEHKGHSIIPKVVEELMHTHPAIKEACLVKRKSSDQLVMCVSLRSRADINTSWELIATELKQYLGGWVLPWQLPDLFVKLEQLPRTSYGRLNRESLAGVMSRIMSIAKVG